MFLSSMLLCTITKYNVHKLSSHILQITPCGGRPQNEKTKNDSQEKKGLAKESVVGKDS